MRKNKYKIDRSSLEILNTKFKPDFSGMGLADKLIYREKDCLLPFFNLENGKSVFLQTIIILLIDTQTDYTIFKPKPGKFKTSKQEEVDGSLYSPFSGNEFNVIDYRTGLNNYDLFQITMFEIFNDMSCFKVVYDFYKENYDKLKFNYLK
jgi:hypothetical protein